MQRVSLLFSPRQPGYKWLKTHTVCVGDVCIGGEHPVRIQSMTNTLTSDTGATAGQVEKLVKAGCELVRISVPGLKDIHPLQQIKNELKKRGVRVPLIADVHFNPAVAEEAARIVEKIRINPGNYVDRVSSFQNHDDKAYLQALEKIRERISPLVKICRQYGTAIRIGSNHGSLSERILARYGNTAEGMVESTLEFVRVFKDLGFTNLILAMKASNVGMMVQATKLLVRKMCGEGTVYPVHLGVTEAGDGDDGRIKSAAGIGALLYSGIGDTVRVSLTEVPEAEIPVAQSILAPFNEFRSGSFQECSPGPDDFFFPPERSFSPSGVPPPFDKPIVVSGKEVIAGPVKPDYMIREQKTAGLSQKLWILKSTTGQGNLFAVDAQAGHSEKQAVLLFGASHDRNIYQIRDLLHEINANHPNLPVILKRDFGNLPHETLMIRASMELGFIFHENPVYGIWMVAGETGEDYTLKLSFDLLQALGLRYYKTEYIACPSCSRTTFDIVTALAGIKEKTSHLAGLKIAVMGCIVNGPGEMAGADYGYVGSGKGKISLFKRNQIIKKDIPEKEATEELVKLLKQFGDWQNKSG
ncbi:MAG: (E)-4-hydroxy-3-methylbut-2-enyl-diphosphate synthase [Bacteroidales bacterium]|nr:(E)-4-hydroxy-3-methylbut-2-enyl-diphosphate synthase [Bacteroidales bacterium]